MTNDEIRDAAYRMAEQDGFRQDASVYWKQAEEWLRNLERQKRNEYSIYSHPWGL